MLKSIVTPQNIPHNTLQNPQQNQSAKSLRVSFGKAIAPFSLMAVLGTTVGIFAIQTSLAPQMAQAYTVRMSVSLDRELDESYEILLRRAESAARAAAQRSFDSDLLVSEVLVTIVGENRGLAVPILSLEVSRVQWSRRPDPTLWTRYYRTAPVLLGIGADLGN